MTTEALQLEINSLKESRAHLEKSRDEALVLVRDLSLQNQELVIKMKHLQVTEASVLASMGSEVKLKNYELARSSLLLSEAEEMNKNLLAEKDQLREKLDVAKEEYMKLKLHSEQSICTLKLEMLDKATRLEAYEKMEKELDKVVVQVGSLPEGSDADALLDTVSSNIPTSVKRRLEYSVYLARKAIDIEQRCHQMKLSLFEARDERQAIEEELEDVKTTASLTKFPITELIILIRRRDAEIRKLENELKVSRESEGKLQKILDTTNAIEKTVTEFLTVLDIHRQPTEDMLIEGDQREHELEKTEETNCESPPAQTNQEGIEDERTEDDRSEDEQEEASDSEFSPKPVQVKPRRHVTFQWPAQKVIDVPASRLVSSARWNIYEGLQLTKPLTITKVRMSKYLMED